MSCLTHGNDPIISFTEEGVMNPDSLTPMMKNWRCYRIEYGFECGCPEGRVWLPPTVDADKLEKFIRDLIKTDKPKGIGNLDYKFTCTKDNPWDKKTKPVLHVDGDFVDDTNMLYCPNCKYSWSLGPDV